MHCLTVKIKSVTSGLKPNNASSYDNSIAPLVENVKRDKEISAKEDYFFSKSDDIAPIGRNDVFGKDFRPPRRWMSSTLNSLFCIDLLVDTEKI